MRSCLCDSSSIAFANTLIMFSMHDFRQIRSCEMVLEHEQDARTSAKARGMRPYKISRRRWN